MRLWISFNLLFYRQLPCLAVVRRSARAWTVTPLLSLTNMEGEVATGGGRDPWNAGVASLGGDCQQLMLSG